MHGRKQSFRRYFVYFCVFLANSLAISAGVAYSWGATIVPILNSNDTSINPLPTPLTTLESSWIVSIMMVACIMGSLIGGAVITALGKKKTILLMGVPFFAAHLIVAFATKVWVLLLARILMGLPLGYVFASLSGYISDITDDHNRGMLSSFPQVFISIGSMFLYGCAPFVSLQLFSLLCLIPIVFLFILFGLFAPETPYDLLKRQHVEEAKKSLAIYRGKTVTAIENEFEKILQSRPNQDDVQLRPSVKELLKTIFQHKALSKGFKMILNILVLQQLSGMAGVASYYQTIFEEASGSMNSIYSVMIIGVVTLLATTTTSQLVERLGRRSLLLSSFTFLALPLFSLGTYFFFKSRGDDISSISSWLPITSLIIYVIGYNLGAGLVWVFVVDIFTPDLVDVCTTIVSFIMYFLAFVLALTFPYLNQGIGIHGTFFLYGAVQIFGLVYAILLVPETKGKTIEEVQQMLSSGKNK